MEEEVTVKARKAIDPLWTECLSHARGWGLKGKGDNIFEGSNIVLINKDEVVVLAMQEGRRGDQRIAIHEFKRATNTVLGNRVTNLLYYHKVPRSYKKWQKK